MHEASKTKNVDQNKGLANLIRGEYEFNFLWEGIDFWLLKRILKFGKFWIYKVKTRINTKFQSNKSSK
jgi:hypothetical protein